MNEALELLEKYKINLSVATDNEVVLSKLTKNGVINIIIDDESIFYYYMDKENKKLLISLEKDKYTIL